MQESIAGRPFRALRSRQLRRLHCRVPAPRPPHPWVCASRRPRFAPLLRHVLVDPSRGRRDAIPPLLITHISFLQLITHAIASHFECLALKGGRLALNAWLTNFEEPRGSSPAWGDFAVLCFIEEDRVPGIDIRAIRGFILREIRLLRPHT